MTEGQFIYQLGIHLSPGWEHFKRLGGSADGEVPPLFDDMFIYRGKVTA